MHPDVGPASREEARRTRGRLVELPVRAQWQVKDRVEAGETVEDPALADAAVALARRQWRRAAIRTWIGVALTALAAIYGAALVLAVPDAPGRLLVGFQLLFPVAWWTHVNAALRANAEAALHRNLALATGSDPGRSGPTPPSDRLAGATVSIAGALYVGAMVGPVALGAVLSWAGARPGAWALALWVVAAGLAAWPVHRVIARAGSPVRPPRSAPGTASRSGRSS